MNTIIKSVRNFFSPKLELKTTTFIKEVPSDEAQLVQTVVLAIAVAIVVMVFAPVIFTSLLSTVLYVLELFFSAIVALLSSLLFFV